MNKVEKFNSIVAEWFKSGKMHLAINGKAWGEEDEPDELALWLEYPAGSEEIGTGGTFTWTQLMSMANEQGLLKPDKPTTDEHENI